ncbi:MAG TPA: hypothetical protein VG206_20000 [Terriglobia bacterium]|nr:hypothetical protein [Terriglobia bacterium]
MNPTAYAKAPGAWWVRGYVDWTWIRRQPENPHRSDDGRWVLKFPELWRVRVVDQLGPGPDSPITNIEGTASLSLASREAAESLRDLIKSVVKPELESPFTPEYVASLPKKPMSAGFRSYLYIFWVGLAAAIMLGVLWGANAPSWITVPAVAAGCFVVVRLIRGWEAKKARER